MKDCADINQALGAWLDGELKTSDAENVRRHVANCVACAREQSRLVKLDAALKTALTPAVEIAVQPFWRGIQERIDQKRPWTTMFGDWLRARWVAPSLAWAVPAAIVIILAFFSVDNYWPGWRGAQRDNFAAVESIDAHGRDVALLREDETKTTVIWLFQNQEGDDETAPESAPKGPRF
jgi:hypothetical protein